MRSALLEQMSGALCDAALETTGSAARLEALAESNLLVVPLDDRRKLYRYHQMFRGLLRAEVVLREPELLPQIRRRAGEWCEANGLPDAAVGYMMAAGDADNAAQLILQQVLPMYRAGRIVTLRRWFDWFDDHRLMDSHPTVAVVGAWLAALTGQSATAERWADLAERGSREGQDPDDSTSIAGLRAMLRSGLCQRGVDQMLADAEHAEQLIAPASSWRALVLALLGIARLLTGNPDRADEALAHAVEVAGEDGALPAASVALAERACIAFDRGEHREARSLIASACAIVEEGRFQEVPTNAFVLAVAARITVHEGDVQRAGRILARAQRLRPGLTYALPYLAVQTRLELTRVLLAMADAAGARTVLREADDILRRRPLVGMLQAQADAHREQIARIPVGAIGASALTAAELRLLPLLQTHRTFREIGERLYVSPHTVKTQAISIYRKLGVSSRGDAVQQATELGLLNS
jgi:LuxR family maltose regulon positive regulatory protein